MLQKHLRTEGFSLKNGIYMPKNLSVATWIKIGKEAYITNYRDSVHLIAIFGL